ncbi:MAG: hypothetical protein Q7I93_06300, partial [Syntrophales bacterium]|nr:hypothetical protein [Syntrophales bacterium]
NFFRIHVLSHRNIIIYGICYKINNMMAEKFRDGKQDVLSACLLASVWNKAKRKNNVLRKDAQ